MKKLASLTAISISMFGQTAAYADIWGDAWKVATAPITVPAKAAGNMIQGKDPAQPFKDTIYDHGQLIQDGAGVLQTVHDQISNVPRDIIRANLGNDWLGAYDTLTGDQRIQSEMAITSGRFLGGCLKGQPCNINQVVAMPLAASLRESYKVYIGQAQPMSPQLQALLSNVYPANLLSAIRITTGTLPNVTAPGFINAGNKLFGQDNAVTIGNVIVFSRTPSLNNYQDWHWLLHEMHHVEQYSSYSSDVLEAIDGFSVDYLQHYNSMENDADNTATGRLAALA